MTISLLPYYQLHNSITTLQHLQDKPIMFLNESTLTKEKNISNNSPSECSYASSHIWISWVTLQSAVNNSSMRARLGLNPKYELRPNKMFFHILWFHGLWEAISIGHLAVFSYTDEYYIRSLSVLYGNNILN